VSRGRQSVSHWTREGTFLIEEDFVAGSWGWRLWHEKDHNKTDLGFYIYPSTAAESIGQGKHDQTLGFAAKSLGVPPTIKDWNGL
jgi:hypothetical protein